MRIPFLALTIKLSYQRRLEFIIGYFFLKVLSAFSAYYLTVIPAQAGIHHRLFPLKGFKRFLCYFLDHRVLALDIKLPIVIIFLR